MRTGFLIITLGLPGLEMVGIYLVWREIGLATLVWLAAAFFAGLALLRKEHLEFLPRMARAMLAGQAPFGVLLGSARRVLAGLLLMFPGALSDLMALVLLAWPEAGPPRQPPAAGAGRDETVIEGEYRRLD